MQNNQTVNIEPYIEFFVKFYGEEHRQTIVDKIKSIEIIRMDDYIVEEPAKELFGKPKKYLARDKVEERIKSLNIKGQIEEYKEDAFTSTDPYVSPYCSEVDGKLETHHILFLPSGGLGKLTDHTLIHEINHVICSNFTNITEKGFDYSSGLDEMHISFEKGSEVQTEKIGGIQRRNTELVNEVLNDYMTVKMVQMIKEANASIYPAEKESNGYQRAFYLMKPLLQGTIQDIAHLEIQGKSSNIPDLLGVENFEELNVQLNAFMNYNDFDLMYLSESIAEKLNFDGILRISEVLKNINEIKNLSLTEKERGLIESIEALNDVSVGISKEKELASTTQV